MELLDSRKTSLVIVIISQLTSLDLCYKLCNHTTRMSVGTWKRMRLKFSNRAVTSLL